MRMMTVAMVMSLAISTAAQDSAEDARRKIAAQKITVHFEGTSLGDAIAFLRDATGLNFHLSATVAEHAPDAKVRHRARSLSRNLRDLKPRFRGRPRQVVTLRDR